MSLKSKPTSKSTPSKLYVIRKYVQARSAADAIRKERKQPVDDVWLDEDWKRANSAPKADAIGFVEIAEELEA